VVAALAVALCAPASASGEFAASAMTGNPQGIKLAREVMHAFAHISAYRQSEQHFFQIRFSKNEFYYLYGQAHHAGYAWASERATLAIHRNHVVWWQDALTPSGRHARGVDIVLDRRGSFWAYGAPTHHSCFRGFASGSTLPYRYGGLGYSIGGRMGAPVKGATTDELPYVYRWKVHRTAHETDTIKRASKLVVAGQVSVLRRGGSRAAAFGFTNTYPRRAPRPPTVNLCS
jgi:hypothetical protein